MSGSTVSISPKRQQLSTIQSICFRPMKDIVGEEPRLFCIGHTARGILMVRFTYRGDTIRIIGAGYWRKGRRLYEKENRIES
jgi:uncharacterized DUF497 family protein